MNALLDSDYPIRDLMNFRNIKEEELARAADVSVDYIRKLAKKERKGSIAVLKKIAGKLDVNVEYLLV